MSPDSPQPSVTRRAWRTTASLGCVLGAAAILLSVLLFNDASNTQSALCALRHDLERRVASSQEFLDKHPHGIPGISPKVIRDGITNQQRTITALRHLSC